MGKIGNRLNLDHRKKMQEMLEKGANRKEIASHLNINVTTISKEKKRCNGPYNAIEADENTCKGQHPIDMDILGKKFGLLTVLEYDCIKDHRTWWKCLCECGQTTLMNRKYLLDKTHRGRVISCGCIARQNSPRLERELEISMLCKFQSLRKMVEEISGCWIWTGYINRKSLCPMASWNDKVYSARRLMFEIFNHEKKEVDYVYAGCGERYCINPQHISIGRPKKGHYN